MDDRRFDSLTRALATGKDRRSVLKGLVGLGGAALAGGTWLENDAEAARRPTPTPKPPRCPGQQTIQGGVCSCPPEASHTCGPACCTGTADDPYPRPASHTECCENACCNGACYGEELCCPTNDRPDGRPPTHLLCDGPHGPICVAGTCCDDSDCGDPCQVCNLENHSCVTRCDSETDVCCTNDEGEEICVSGECCPGANCDNSGACCHNADGSKTVCCDPGNICGDDGTCQSPCSADAYIYVQSHGPLERANVCPAPIATLAIELGLYPYSGGVCSDTPIATAWTSESGPAVFSNIPGGLYCALPTDSSIAACLDCPDYGDGAGQVWIPCESFIQQPLGISDCCLKGELDISVFAVDGAGGTFSGVEMGLFANCSDSTPLATATTGSDGEARFLEVSFGQYCAQAVAGSDFSGCGSATFDVGCDFNGWSVIFTENCQCDPKTCPAGECPSSFDNTCGSTLDCSDNCGDDFYCGADAICHPCLTCANVDPGTCPSSFDNLCGSFLDCSDECAQGEYGHCGECQVVPNTTHFSRPIGNGCSDDDGNFYSCLCASGGCDNDGKCCDVDRYDHCDVQDYCASE